jgi:acyl-CoA synthetase (AMP-forming)/AMP-acid ligase II
MDVLMPAWYHGVPVLTFRAPRFDPEQAFAMIGRHQVRTALLVPTMLRLMRQVADPVEHFGARLRVVYSGGESVGKELLNGATKCCGSRSMKYSVRPNATSSLVRTPASCQSNRVRSDVRYPAMSPLSSTKSGKNSRQGQPATSPSAVQIQ